MHEEDLIDTEAAQKRVDAILHEGSPGVRKPESVVVSTLKRRKRSDAGKPRPKKAQEQPQGVLTKEQAREFEAFFSVIRKRTLEYYEAGMALSAAMDEMKAYGRSLTARKEG